ncbi:MAG TPA: phage baseplate assembly protein V [Bacteroidales bacterium]|nr:phage baseplate assembly protein V [Bacteroidales bacterium]
MLQQVELTVKIGGNTISPVISCSINQEINWHHQFEVIYVADFYKEKYNSILNKIRDFIGSEIEITFETIENGKNNVHNRFYGLVTQARLNRTSEGQKEIHLAGFSPTILIDGRPCCRSFTGRLLSEIVQATHDQVPQNDLKLNSNPSYRTDIPYIVQYNESNFEFLNRIAEKYGEWCYYNGSELIFGTLSKSKSIDVFVDNNLQDFNFAFNLKNYGFKAITYDYLENESWIKESKDIAVNDLDARGDHAKSVSEKKFKQENILFSSGLYAKESDFKDFFETRRIADTRSLISNEGQSTLPDINVGSVIKIKSQNDQEDDFGEFIITSVKHIIDTERKYKNYFTAIPKSINKPPLNNRVKLPACEMQPAVISSNDDPENLGRVKARFFWDDHSETPWLRVLNPHGGKSDKNDQHGFYFIPEINDEVMIGFEGNDPDKPFVMGSVYHKNSKPDHWYHSQNNTKSIRTRNGNQILFIDEDGKEEIRILNKDDGSPKNEISLSMDNKGKITIKTEGELEISADSIKISAKSDIQIDSGKGTKLTATDHTINASKGVNIKGQQMDINGTQTDIKATTLKINGSAQTEISGAMVKVAGSGITEVTGGLVKIN